jgi:hypothetical protein
VVKKVGDGRLTAFWTDIWISNVSLKDRFPRLFSVSSIQEAKVGSAGSWVNGRWCWAIAWRQNLFVWEDELRAKLMEILLGASLSMLEDKWVWLVEADGVFSVKSCYSLLSRRVLPLVDIPVVYFIRQQILFNDYTLFHSATNILFNDYTAIDKVLHINPMFSL